MHRVAAARPAQRGPRERRTAGDRPDIPAVIWDALAERYARDELLIEVGLAAGAMARWAQQG